jgi:hypothetical protein
VTKWDSSARPDPNAESGVRESDGATITPMEAVISEKSSKKLHAAAELTEQITEERAKRQSEPVHMDGLQPLPSGMPRLPNGVIPGGDLATTLVPSMRKTIPVPFKRESINAGRHGKTWAYMAADQVVKDDIVVDFGKIARVTPYVAHQTDPTSRGRRRIATREGIVLTNIVGEDRDVGSQDQLRVFRVHEEPDAEALVQENKMIDNEMYEHGFSGETLRAPGEPE